jgi:ABC-type dipeptide/oligopeptide/nickel transport system permease subunit
MSVENKTELMGQGQDRLAPPAESREAIEEHGSAMATAGAERAVLRSTPGYYTRAWRSLRRDKVAMASLYLSIALIIFSFGAPLVARIVGHDYATGNLADYLQPAFQSWNHPLGTDANGRDILVRLAYGGRVSMTVAILALLFAFLIGVTLGAISGFYGGLVDSLIMRFVDVIISIPGITLLLLVSVWWQPDEYGLALVIAALSWTGLARLIRGEVLSIRSRDYVDAARVLGAPNRAIIVRHIIPNVISIMIVWASLALPGLIITEATLSYLGFGVKIPVPSWGNMLQEAYQFISLNWTYAFFPGFAIFLAALSFNLLGVGLRDALDPRLNN